MNNPVVFGMLGPLLVTLGFSSSAVPESNLFIDPKYHNAEPARAWLNDEPARDWSNDR